MENNGPWRRRHPLCGLFPERGCGHHPQIASYVSETGCAHLQRRTGRVAIIRASRRTKNLSGRSISRSGAKTFPDCSNDWYVGILLICDDTVSRICTCCSTTTCTKVRASGGHGQGALSLAFQDPKFPQRVLHCCYVNANIYLTCWRF